MRIHRSSLFLAMLLPSCTAASSADQGTSVAPPAPADVGTRSEALSTPPNAAEACLANRWLGTTSSTSGSCQPAKWVPPSEGGSWSTSLGFAGTATSPPGMARLCKYEWVPAPGSTTDGSASTSALPADVDGRPASDWLHPDCQVVAPLYSGMPIDFFEDLSSQFLSQLGAPPRLPIGAKPPSSIRVAVVDSSPDSNGGPINVGVFQHGFSLAQLIENVTCPKDADGALTGACVGAPSTYLALGRITSGAAPSPYGGYFGSQYELAAAIKRAVDDFRGEAISGQSAARLVINLSVGWESTWGGDFGDGMAEKSLRGGALFVEQALVHASCHGAIVVAAAGNASGGPSPNSGPMYPAGWERATAPSAAQCETFEGAGYAKAFKLSPVGTAKNRPLVYAASGVDGRDHPLQPVRVGARARLSAPAEKALGIVHPGEQYGFPGYPAEVAASTMYGAPLTGTSASAAAVSATAAVVWGYRPELTADKVMSLVYQSGAPLSPAPDGTALNADFCLRAPCDPVVRTDVCRALAAACAAPTDTCLGISLKCASPASYGGASSTPSDTSLAELDATLPAVSVVAKAGAPLDLSWTVCGSTYVPPSTGEISVDPCPDREYPNAYDTPWVGPQPNVPSCPSCTLALSQVCSGCGYQGSLYLLIEQGGTYGAPVLQLTSPGYRPWSYDLSSYFRGGVMGSVRYRVDGIAVPATAVGDSLTVGLSMVANSGVRTYSTIAPVMVRTQLVY